MADLKRKYGPNILDFDVYAILLFFPHLSENIFKTVRKILFSRKTVHSAEIERNISDWLRCVQRHARIHTELGYLNTYK